MGQFISKIYGSALREAKMYNIEKRAEKVISKDKPTRAPMHPSAAKELESLREGNVSTDYLYKKDQALNEHLKKVFVTTPDPSPPRLENPVRPLPQSRLHREGMSFGYCEAEEEKVPEGKVSLKQALQFIVAHQTDPVTHTSAAISQQYKLDPKISSDILEHFKMFNVHFKKKKEVDPDSLSEQEKLAMRVQAMTMINASEIVKELKLGSRFKSKTNLSSSLDKTNVDTIESNENYMSRKNDTKDNR